MKEKAVYKVSCAEMLVVMVRRLKQLRMTSEMRKTVRMYNIYIRHITRQELQYLSRRSSQCALKGALSPAGAPQVVVEICICH